MQDPLQDLLELRRAVGGLGAVGVARRSAAEATELRMETSIATRAPAPTRQARAGASQGLRELLIG